MAHFLRISSPLPSIPSHSHPQVRNFRRCLAQTINGLIRESTHISNPAIRPFGVNSENDLQSSFAFRQAKWLPVGNIGSDRLDEGFVVSPIKELNGDLFAAQQASCQQAVNSIYYNEGVALNENWRAKIKLMRKKPSVVQILLTPSRRHTHLQFLHFNFDVFWSCLIHYLLHFITLPDRVDEMVGPVAVTWTL